jgi:hypothetical protein
MFAAIEQSLHEDYEFTKCKQLRPCAI